MTICYFGNYDSNYSRNHNLIKGLRQLGLEVLEINYSAPCPIKYFKLIGKHWQVRNQYDLMMVGFCGHFMMPLAWLLCRRPLIFDAHISLYEANVFQKKYCRPRSLRAMFYYLVDWLACFLSQAVLLDTSEHVNYFVRTFKFKKDKFLVVYNGVDSELFFPREKTSSDEFIIEFHAYATLLHGLEYILLAMKELANRGEAVKFLCVGSGSEYERAKQLTLELQLTNIDFFPPLSPSELQEKIIAQVDLGLGIFGATAKVNRVIANKVYELMACRVPVITADSPAMRERFNHLSEVYFCSPADSQSLAEAIITLKNDPELRQRLADAAYDKIIDQCQPKHMARQLIDGLKLRII